MLDPRIPALYERFHKPEFIHPDPLEMVRAVADPREREVTALISAALALGRVESILSFQKSLFQRLGNTRETCTTASYKDLQELLKGMKYRFYPSEEIAALCYALGRIVKTYGSLNEAFLFCMGEVTDLEEALKCFVSLIKRECKSKTCILPSPEGKSACKRLFLFLRWMVRRDCIDPGGWEGIPLKALLVPLDTHMLRVAGLLNLTGRRSADYVTAREITKALSQYDPEDPVKYDFSLTRPGINPCLDYSCFEEAIPI